VGKAVDCLNEVIQATKTIPLPTDFETREHKALVACLFTKDITHILTSSQLPQDSQTIQRLMLDYVETLLEEQGEKYNLIQLLMKFPPSLVASMLCTIELSPNKDYIKTEVLLWCFYPQHRLKDREEYNEQRHEAIRELVTQLYPHFELQVKRNVSSVSALALFIVCPF